MEKKGGNSETIVDDLQQEKQNGTEYKLCISSQAYSQCVVAVVFFFIWNAI